MPAFTLCVCSRLQRETEHIQQWLEGAEEKAAKDEDLSVLQEEALQQR